MKLVSLSDCDDTRSANAKAMGPDSCAVILRALLLRQRRFELPPRTPLDNTVHSSDDGWRLVGIWTPRKENLTAYYRPKSEQCRTLNLQRAGKVFNHTKAASFASTPGL